MICPRCTNERDRPGQRLCRACHARTMKEHRRRVKQTASRDFGFISHETDRDEIATIAAAVSALEGGVA